MGAGMGGDAEAERAWHRLRAALVEAARWRAGQASGLPAVTWEDGLRRDVERLRIEDERVAAEAEWERVVRARMGGGDA